MDIREQLASHVKFRIVLSSPGMASLGILAALAVFLLWGVISSPGMLRGHDMATNAYAAYEASTGSWGQVWDDLRFPGTTKPAVRMTWVQYALVGLTNLSGDVWVSMRAMDGILIFVALVAMYLLALHFTRSHLAGVLAAAVYVFNRGAPFQGQLAFTAGYALMPLVFLSLDRLLSRGRFMDVALFALVYAAFFTAAILPLAYIVTLLLPVYVIIYLLAKAKSVREVYGEIPPNPPLRKGGISSPLSQRGVGGDFPIHLTKIGLFALALALAGLLSSYYIAGLLISTAPTVAGEDYPAEDVSRRAVSLVEAVTLRSAGGFIFDNAAMDISNLLIALLAFSVILYRRTYWVGAFTAIALVSIFFASQVESPAYRFFFSNVPFFSLIRIARRWEAVTLLCYAVLVGAAASYASAAIVEASRRLTSVLNRLYAKMSGKSLLPWREKVRACPVGAYSCTPLRAEGMKGKLFSIGALPPHLDPLPPGERRYRLFHAELVLVIGRLVPTLAVVSLVVATAVIHWEGLRNWFQTYTLPRSYVRPYEWLRDQGDDAVVVATPFLQARVYDDWSLVTGDYSRHLTPGVAEKPLLTGFRVGGLQINEELRALVADAETPVVFEQEGLALQGQQAALPRRWDNFLLETVLRVTGATGGRGYVEIAFRLGAPGQSYAVELDEQARAIRLMRRGGGTQVLDSANMRLQRGREYRLNIAAEGPLLRVYLDGQRVLSATDPTWRSGEVVVQAADARAEFRLLRIARLPRVVHLDQGFMKLLALYNVGYVVVQPYTSGVERDLFQSFEGYAPAFWRDGALVAKNEFYFPKVYAPGNLGVVVGAPVQSVMKALASVDGFSFEETLLLNLAEAGDVASKARYLIISGQPPSEDSVSGLLRDGLIPVHILDVGGFESSEMAPKKSSFVARSNVRVLFPGEYRLSFRVAGPELEGASAKIAASPGGEGRALTLAPSEALIREYRNYLTGELDSYHWLTTEPVSLLPGEYTLEVQSSGVQPLVDSALLYAQPQGASLPTPESLFGLPGSEAQLTFEKASPTKYRVNVSAPGGAFLVFKDTYHQGWQASAGEGALPHYAAYGLLNAFWVPDTGSAAIPIELTFAPQQPFEIARWLSLAAFVGLAIATAAWAYLKNAPQR